MKLRAWLAFTAAVLGSACGASSGGPPQSPEFAAVQAVLDARCVTCHDASATKLTPGVQRYPQLPLTSGRAYDALVGQPADETCGGTRVVPHDTAHSYLEHKLLDQYPCAGGRMPMGGEAMQGPTLSQAELDAFATWIAAGAPR